MVLAAALYSVLAFILSAFLLRLTYYQTSDGIAYVRLAHHLFTGQGITINSGEPYVRHPPLYSFLLGLGGLLFRDLEFSAHLVSMLCFSLTLIPLFLLTRKIYSENTAHWASLLYATNGFLLIYSNLIMTEPLFILLIFIELYSIYKMIQATNPCFWPAFIFGMAAGLAYLTRPEGLLYYWVGALSIFFLCQKPLRVRVRLVLFSLIPFVICFLPYVFFVSKATGHLQFSGLARENIIYRQLDLSHPGQYSEVKKIYEGLTDDKKKLKMVELVENFNLLYYLKADRFVLIRSGLNAVLFRFLEFNKYFFGGLGLLFAGVSLIHSSWDVRRKRPELLLIAFTLPFLAQLFLLFDQRRYLPVYPIFLIWMGNGIEVFRNWVKGAFALAEKHANGIALILCLVLFLPSLWYLNRSVQKSDFHSGEKELGLWMKKSIPHIDEEPVATQNHYVNYYSGSRILKLPYVEKFEDFLTYMALQKAKYFVVTEKWDPPVLDSYRFLLDEKSAPQGIIPRHTVLGDNEKTILYEIQR